MTSVKRRENKKREGKRLHRGKDDVKMEAEIEAMHLLTQEIPQIDSSHQTRGEAGSNFFLSLQNKSTQLTPYYINN